MCQFEIHTRGAGMIAKVQSDLPRVGEYIYVTNEMNKYEVVEIVHKMHSKEYLGKTSLYKDNTIVYVVEV